MATYDYRNEKTGEVEERIFLPGERAPEVDGDWIRLFPAPRIVTNDTRGFRRVPNDRVLAAQGKRVVEPGYDRDVERAKQYQIEKQDREREKLIAQTVSDFTL